jgi:hypothetical protein
MALDITAAVRSMIERHKPGLDRPNVYLDPDGNDVPWDVVEEGSPGGVSPFGMEYVDPTPGHGLYVRLFQRSMVAHRDGRREYEYVISGPDWEIVATTMDNPQTETERLSVAYDPLSPRGEEFMSRYAP